MHVADFGCGRTGHIVFPAARIVGDKGLVYAVDILKDALEVVAKRADLEGFTNIHGVWADIDHLEVVRLPKRTLDVAFFVNVLNHCGSAIDVLQKLDGSLKEKGRAVIVDWVRPLGNVSPNKESMLDFDACAKGARSLGFVVQKDERLGDYHRCLVLYRA